MTLVIVCFREFPRDNKTPMTDLFIFLANVLTSCGIFDYDCGNGTCISEELVCDGKADCFNRTDELEEVCLKVRCPKYAFRCSYGACIDSTKLCNGKKDCLDGSDEISTNCREEEENSLVGCP